MRERPLVLASVVILLGFVATAFLTGEPTFAIPVAIFFGLAVGAYAFDWGLKKRIEARHDGDFESAAADHEDPVPSTHRQGDDETALGDTPEAHDEISPHDLPIDHPGRAAAERQGVTGGDR